MDYSSVVESLFERHRSVRDSGFSGDAYKPGLDAMLSYCDFLGHPERKFRSIHVAGTNGKGSVCSMLAAALASRGLRVGLYTSPHLVDFRERIKIIGPLATASLSDARQAVGHEIPWPPAASEREGPAPLGVGGKERAARAEGFQSNLPASGAWLAEMIPEEAVCEFMQRYDREGLTFFELTTGMAFWWFAQQGVDVAVIETGLGGRLDSTNVITPELSVITSIGLDHCDLLGSTRAEIAAEKAGIFKPGVPAVVWGRDQETQPVFELTAADIGAPLYFAEDYPIFYTAETLTLDLYGPCQDINLRTVLAALTILSVFRDWQPTEYQQHTKIDHKFSQTERTSEKRNLIPPNENTLIIASRYYNI